MEKTSEKRKSKQSDRGGMLEKKGKNRSNRIEVGSSNGKAKIETMISMGCSNRQS
jgi:hypothetical protein